MLDESEVDLSKFETKNPCLILRDIQKNNLRDEHVAYEIDKLRPNYGSSSDLLRYNILFREGGFYCDCTDVKIGKTNLSEILSQKFEKPVLFLEHRPQEPELPLKELKEFSLDKLGNDTFLATGPKNPLALDLFISAKKKYSLSKEFCLEHILAAHSGNNIKHSTIARTGPALLREVFLKPDKFERKGSILILEKGEIRRVRDGVINLVTPGENTGNWLNTRIIKYNNPEKAINAVVKTITFEAKYLKILRLDDHIHDLITSTEGKITSKEALFKLIPSINLIKKDIQYTQLTGKYVETIKFTEENKLISIFNLSTEGYIQAINCQAYLYDFLIAEQTATNLNDTLSKQAKENKTTVIGLILSSQRYGTKINLCGNIQQGIIFFKHLSNHFDRFSSEKSKKIRAYLIERLKKYEEYTEIFKLSVEDKYLASLIEIKLLLEKLTISADKGMVKSTINKFL